MGVWSGSIAEQEVDLAPSTSNHRGPPYARLDLNPLTPGPFILVTQCFHDKGLAHQPRANVVPIIEKHKTPARAGQVASAVPEVVVCSG